MRWNKNIFSYGQPSPGVLLLDYIQISLVGCFKGLKQDSPENCRGNFFIAGVQLCSSFLNLAICGQSS